MSQPTHFGFLQRSRFALSAWAVVAAFGAYFCMYGFRKPFTGGEYLGVVDWGVSFKTVLITAQTVGYALSKFVGIKVISEMPAGRRAVGILVLIGLSHVALLGFGLVSAPYNLIFLFFNGLPLGMVFGLVLGYLEGRGTTEALTAGLCASFIIAGGVTKTVGAKLIDLGVDPMWMPFVAGCIFALPLVGFVWMLSKIPPPSAVDIALRSERTVMSAADRWSFFRRYAPGLTLLIVVYLLVTILRGVRDDFGPEIWRGLGWNGAPSVFTWSEMFVALGVVVASGAAFLIRDNRKAFHFAMGTSMFGLLLAGLAVFGLSRGWLGGMGFMVMVGLGMYLPYVAVHTTLFERLIAMTRDRGNLGYLMYLADSFGYLGFVLVIVVKDYATVGGEVLPFFTSATWVAAGIAVVALATSWAYFARNRPKPAAVAMSDGRGR